MQKKYARAPPWAIRKSSNKFASRHKLLKSVSSFLWMLDKLLLELGAAGDS
jgi:hypothetical protein